MWKQRSTFTGPAFLFFNGGVIKKFEESVQSQKWEHQVVRSYCAADATFLLPGSSDYHSSLCYQLNIRTVRLNQELVAQMMLWRSVFVFSQGRRLAEIAQTNKPASKWTSRNRKDVNKADKTTRSQSQKKKCLGWSGWWKGSPRGVVSSAGFPKQKGASGSIKERLDATLFSVPSESVECRFLRNRLPASLLSICLRSHWRARIVSRR